MASGTFLGPRRRLPPAGHRHAGLLDRGFSWPPRPDPTKLSPEETAAFWSALGATALAS